MSTTSPRPLKAYVRYANNKAVAGSLIFRKSMPKNGKWVEVPMYLCCNPTTTTTTTAAPTTTTTTTARVG